MSTKHTPGPWLVSQSAARFAVPGCHSAAQDEANAKLIAAAPEMVEALQTIALHCPSLDVEGIRALCDAALAKAGL